MNEKSELKRGDYLLTFALRLFAWILLIVGIVFSLFVWYKYGEIEIGEYYKFKVENPVGKGIAFSVFIISVIYWLILLGFAKIIEHLTIIREILKK
jgi:type VI protein secretion system component VasK